MSYFNISLDKDMDFLIRELGQDIKINNEPIRGLIQNIDNVDYTNDDKELITISDITRGNYIYYNNKYWLMLSEINDKRYNIYNKGVIRDCNFDVKFIINNRLYLFPSIIQGDKFYIQEGNIVDISADTITVTLPETPITRQLKITDRFIKWGTAWKVEGIDYTKNGLIILNCKVELTNSAIDDIENEIAGRYREGSDGKKIDRLKKGNTEPIYPFDDVEVPEEPEPETPEEPKGDYTIKLECGYDSLVFGLPIDFTATVYLNGEEVDKIVKFELVENPHLAWIEVDENNPNMCNIYGNKERDSGTVTLRVYLIDDKNVYIEKELNVGAW